MAPLAVRLDESGRRTVPAKVTVRPGQPLPTAGAVELLVVRSLHGHGDQNVPAPLIQVRYRDTLLCEESLRGSELRLTLPFSGGTLDLLAFRCTVSAPTGAEDEQYAAEVTIRQPALSDFEQRATAQLEEEVARLTATELAQTATFPALLGLRSQLVIARRDP